MCSIFWHACDREVYHTKRMQRVSVVRWSLDNKYLLSGSMEMNIRVWKARASEKIGIVWALPFRFVVTLTCAFVKYVNGHFSN